jgi:hypothetical protein
MNADNKTGIAELVLIGVYLRSSAAKKEFWF